MFAAAGKTVASVWGSGSFFDNCGRGASLGATGGNIVRCVFNQCWFSSASTDHGCIAFTSPGGFFSGLSLTDCDFYLNTIHGFCAYDTGVKDVQVNGGRFAQNGSAGLAFGVSQPVSKWSVLGVASGQTNGLAGNQYGIFVFGSPNNYTCALNDFTGNTVASQAGLGVSTAILVNFANRF